MSGKIKGWADKPLNMDEAANALGISRRTLGIKLKEFAFYELRGNKKVFYPEHIEGLRKCAYRSNGSTDGRNYKALDPTVNALEKLSKLVM